jgi:D-serine deaminase-like pyridoxal phosphate-dependent protein
MKDWYSIDNIDQLDTPALVVYPDRVKENINILKKFVPDVNRLRPHVKTNKCAEVCKLMMDAGIYKFKCATISEAEMLAGIQAKDVLLAYQPVGPKVNRLLELIKKYPSTRFSCLIDNIESAREISQKTSVEGKIIPVYIDLNVGMNRTGITPDGALELVKNCSELKGIKVIGLHAYDGHLRDSDIAVRKKKCDEVYEKVELLKDKLEKYLNYNLIVIAGGTPTFPIHAERKGVECSPGTFIFWDKGYEQILPEQPFLFAALIITRIISKPTDEIVTTDLGHKAIASENPLTNRVYFLNAPDLQPIGHSEEHFVLTTSHTELKVGDVLYGVPYHVCPTVALHETMYVLQDHKISDQWKVISRKRKINI